MMPTFPNVLKWMIFVVAFSCIGGVSANGGALHRCAEKMPSIDMDRDGTLDCVRVRQSKSTAKLEIWLSSSRKWALLQEYVKSDEVLAKQSLKSYRNPKFKGGRSGDALRLMFPEKSSVLFYWDSKDRQIQEFWESD